MGVYSKARQRLIEALGAPAVESVTQTLWRYGPPLSLLEVKLQDLGDLALIGVERAGQHGDSGDSLVPVRVPSDVDWIIRQVKGADPTP